MNNTIAEMKNTLEGINRRTNKAEEWISELERMVEITATEQNKEKRMKRNEDNLGDLGDNTKCTNICTIGAPEGKIFEEIMAENIPNLMKTTNLKFQKLKGLQFPQNVKKTTVGNITKKLMEVLL